MAKQKMTMHELLKDVDDNFDAFGISAMNDENGYQIGRPYGGLAVLWRKEFKHPCTLLTLDNVGLFGVTFDTNLGKISFGLELWLG